VSKIARTSTRLWLGVPAWWWVAALAVIAILLCMDHAVYDWTQPLGGVGPLRTIARVVSEGFQHTWPLLGLVVIAAAPRGRRLRFALVLLVALAAQAVVVELLKALIGRPRPVDAAESAGFLHAFSGHHSMPSGHAAGAFALATLVAALHPRGWWGFGAWAGAIALARVLMGRHYLSDVAVGAFLGMIIARAALRHLWDQAPHPPSRSATRGRPSARTRPEST